MFKADEDIIKGMKFVYQHMKVIKQSSNHKIWWIGFDFMVFNATFNNISAISWWSVLLLEETGFVNYKNGCTRLAAASDKDYQLLSHGRWFSPGTPASSTTKTGRHDIAEILLNVALNTKDKKSINPLSSITISWHVGDYKTFKVITST